MASARVESAIFLLVCLGAAMFTLNQIQYVGVVGEWVDAKVALANTSQNEEPPATGKQQGCYIVKLSLAGGRSAWVRVAQAQYLNMVPGDTVLVRKDLADRTTKLDTSCIPGRMHN